MISNLLAHRLHGKMFLESNSFIFELNKTVNLDFCTYLNLIKFKSYFIYFFCLMGVNL